MMGPLAGARRLRELARTLGYPEDMRPWGGFLKVEDSFGKTSG
jgi:hypothetical protein